MPRTKSASGKGGSNKSSAVAVTISDHTPARINTIGGFIARHVVQSLTAKHDLGILEWRIMLVLGCDELATINHITDRVAMDRGGCSRAITRLEIRGLIERVPDRKDRRLSPIRLTGKGIKLQDDLAQMAVAREKKFLEVLTPAERKQLNGMLFKLECQIRKMYDENWSP